MLTIILFAVAAPSGAAAGYLALRRRLPGLVADVRGIALQTVIIMVVLLAVAGAVAGVLLTRGSEAVSEVERQDITREASEFSNERLCEAYGFSWAGVGTNASCYSTVPARPDPALIGNKNDCIIAVHLGANAGFSWTPMPGSTDPDNDGVCA